MALPNASNAALARRVREVGATRRVKRPTADICHCRHPRHYHANAAGASPLKGDGQGACLVDRCGCNVFRPVGGKP